MKINKNWNYREKKNGHEKNKNEVHGNIIIAGLFSVDIFYWKEDWSIIQQ